MTEIRHSTDEPRGETARLLKMLRKRVRYLLHEVQRLRDENASMSRRLEELEEQVDHEGTLLTLDDDPDELRRRIRDYIEVIDEELGEG